MNDEYNPLPTLVDIVEDYVRAQLLHFESLKEEKPEVVAKFHQLVNEATRSTITQLAFTKKATHAHWSSWRSDDTLLRFLVNGTANLYLTALQLGYTHEQITSITTEAVCVIKSASIADDGYSDGIPTATELRQMFDNDRWLNFLAILHHCRSIPLIRMGERRIVSQ